MIIKFLQSVDPEKEQVGSQDPSAISGESSAAAAEFIDAISTADSNHVVAAYLTEGDYRLARMIVPEMSTFEDYEDWLDFRTGVFWGLEMAGFTVNLVPVDLSEFAIWRVGFSSAHAVRSRRSQRKSADLFAERI